MMTKFFVFCLMAALCIQLSIQQTADCVSEAEPGPCRMLLKRFFFNTATNTCEEFTYGGCAGNGNNYPSVEECQAACVAARK